MNLETEAFLEIDESALKHNFKWYQSVTDSDFICPMIKANAYGVGDDLVLKVLSEAGCKYIGVARLSEALNLRKQNSEIKIILFNHFCSKDIDLFIQFDIRPVVSSFEQLDLLVANLKTNKFFGIHKKLKIHIEFDTGMNRLGFSSSEALRLIQTILAETSLEIEGVFTHFLNAFDWGVSKGRSEAQYKIFEGIELLFEKEFSPSEFKNIYFHLASSKAMNMNAISSHKKIKDGLRPGIGLYGLSQDHPYLKKVLRLWAPVINLKWIQKGETVSYDGLWVAQRESLIACLPLGYADGYPRALGGQSYVLFGEEKAPIVGAVCMDFMMLDVTDLAKKPSLGDLALVFGKLAKDQEIKLEHLAKMANVISYEFLVMLGSRLSRRGFKN